MDSLKALVAKWREHDERLLRENPGDDPIAMQTRAIAAARLGRADELEAALADTGTLTDEMIEQRARGYAGAMDGRDAEVAYEAVVDTAKWARDFHAPTRDQIAALRLDTHPDEGFRMAWNRALDAALALCEPSAAP